jgi:hypothetical protein
MSKEKMIIGLGTPLEGTDRPPTVIFGLHPAAWDAMAQGHTQTADLTKVGIPATVLIFRAGSYDDAIAQLSAETFEAGIPFRDQRGTGEDLPDLGIQTTTWKRGEFVEVIVPEVMGGGSGEKLEVLAVGHNDRGTEHVMVQNGMGLVVVKHAAQLRYWKAGPNALDLLRKPRNQKDAEDLRRYIAESGMVEHNASTRKMHAVDPKNSDHVAAAAKYNELADKRW